MPLKKYVTPLAIPPILMPFSRARGTCYEVKMKQVKQKQFRNLLRF
ncbi:hypothetical protein J28TS4_16180 [Paenibacillus lautus]|nr:hypothetical protein J28TS4_16180 [Paenibacillus lautus]